MILYFLPIEARTADLLAIADLGLGHAFETKPAARDCTSGPGGAAGCVVSVTLDPSAIGYFPERQTWRKMLDSPCYLCVVGDTRPEDLQRAKMLPGNDVELAGHRWTIPIVREFRDEGGEPAWIPSLPQKMRYIGAGVWTAGEVNDRYRRLWELAIGYETAIADAWAGAPDDAEAIQIEFDGINDLAVEALRTNYRVGPEEIDALELLDIESRSAIIRAVLNSDLFDRWLQKKTAAEALSGSPSSAGRGLATPAGTVATVPA